MNAPAKIGKYPVLRKLGQGGMGTVFLVQDPQTGRELALKLTPRDAASPDAAARFWREAEVLARIQHRHVVRVHSVGQAPQGQYLVEERVEGRTLEAVLDDGPLDPARAARVVADVADAIHAVHEHGILYRDLKPSNVMLRADDSPVLLDFGLARDEDAERLTRTGQLLGTPAFMAPEQAGGVRPGELGPAVDVYGLGALLYALLVGRPPFEGPLISVVAQVLEQEPEWPRAARPDVPPALDAVVRLAMAKAPGARYADAAALRDDLRRFLAGERTRAEARGGGPGGGGRRALAVAGALAIVVAVAAGLVAARRAPASVAATTEAASTPSQAAAAAPPVHRVTPEEQRWRAVPLPAGLRPGDAVGEYVNDADGSVLVWVPGGTFTMGSEEALKPDGHDSPAHRVRLGGYFIGKLEVTWSQYRGFCQATGRAPPPVGHTYEGLDLTRLPVSNVTWQEAADYCAWAGLRLPTEAEWELAARGLESRVHPWGPAPPTPERANYNRGPPWRPRPVGATPAGASPSGCLDMAGNVWEWVQDPFNVSYGELSFDAVLVDPEGAAEGAGRTVRGGGYDTVPQELHAAYRLCIPDPETRRSPNVGFRVAASRP